MDLMHLMDCKGVTGLVAGSALGLLMRRAELGANKAERLQVINDHRETWYDAVRPRTHRLPKLLEKNLVNNGWGELAGPAIKAALTRACAPWIRDLCQQYCTSYTDEDRAVRQLTEDLVEFYRILYTDGIFMSDEGLARLGLVAERFGCNFMRLREYASRADVRMWKLTPKVHNMQHVHIDIAQCTHNTHIAQYAKGPGLGAQYASCT